MSNSRKRIMISKPGGYGAFAFDQTPLEDPLPGQVQVEVKACGINFADVAVRLGLYAAAKGRYPICPGLEFAGVVSRTGSRNTPFREGDRVFGATRFGAYTTAINSPPEHLWPLPEHWDFKRGATFPVAYLTAFYALHSVGKVNPGDQVLVHSAAGGVGTALLHLLKIIQTCSVGVVGRPEKVSAAAAAGATVVIDKSTENLWETAEEVCPEGYDLILDANGASTLRRSYDHLRPAGRLVIYGFASMFSHTGRKNWLKLIWYYFRTPRFNPFEMTGANRTVSGFNLIYLFERASAFRDMMATLVQWDKERLLPPMPIQEVPFTEVAEAHRSLESGDSVGKLVLTV
jgi:NADPH:quinone reductase-like Zn-dependent oxidoreductase